MKLVRELQHWSQGIRLYLGIGIVVYTLESWWWAETAYGGSILFATRLGELYAWSAIALLAVAVSIGPICSTWPKIPGKQLLFDARRLLGIGAAWFSVLHITISYASLFKFANPFTLPGTYQRAFGAGLVASLILLAMAFTSFDKAFHGMGKWWFRLHRLVYAAVILSLLHAFLIGTHATHLPELTVLTVAVIFTVGLHLYLAFLRNKTASKWQVITIPIIAVILFITLSFGFSQHLGHNPSKGHPDHSAPAMPHMDGMDGMDGMEMQDH